MKKCPSCNRTYSDETITFCLIDGAILSAPYDPQATEIINNIPIANLPPTESPPKGKIDENISSEATLPLALGSAITQASKGRLAQPIKREYKRNQIIAGFVLILILCTVIAFIIGYRLSNQSIGNSNFNSNSVQDNQNINNNMSAAQNSNVAIISNENSSKAAQEFNATTWAADKREYFEESKEEYIRGAKASGHYIGSGANDGWIHFQVRNFIVIEATNNPEEYGDATVVIISVDNGNVVLSGRVEKRKLRLLADEIAKSVQGVKNVRNNITVAD